MNKALLAAGAAGLGLLYLHGKASASPAARSEELRRMGVDAASGPAPDPGMSDAQLALWRQLVQLEGDPGRLRAQADGYAAAGFPNASRVLRRKVELLS